MRFSYLMLMLCFTTAGFAQQRQATKAPLMPAKRGVLMEFHYALQMPGGDMKTRFGANSSVGFSASYKTRSNWIIGAEINYLFGGNVKENNALDSIIGPQGELIDENGNPASIRLYERGFTTFVKVGKIVWHPANNENSGILLQLGGGFMQHKIKYNFAQDLLPQLEGDYIKGYDRLTNGLMTYEFIGYQHMNPRQYLSLVAGVEFYQGYTQNRREFNYDTRAFDTAKRLDLLYSVKFGVIIPIYFKGSRDEQKEYFFN